MYSLVCQWIPWNTSILKLFCKHPFKMKCTLNMQDAVNKELHMLFQSFTLAETAGSLKRDIVFHWKV